LIKKSIRGFTLIEVILSIALLGIIALFVLPMTMYGVKYSKWNDIRRTALNLGYSQVEWLKTLDYDELGLNIENYSPSGVVNENLYMNDESSSTLLIEGIEYSLNTNVVWEDAISSTGEPVPTAIKKVEVTIEAKDPFLGIKKEYSVLSSLISKESERVPAYPGHLKVFTYFQNINSPQKNVMIRISEETGALVSMSKTDIDGRALIGNLIEGEYEVELVSWEFDELMVLPNGVTIVDSIPKWKENEIVFVPYWDKNNTPEYPTLNLYIDLPGYIILPMDEGYPNATVSIKPSSGSYNPPEGQASDHMLLVTNLENIDNTRFWRLWRYEYEITYNEENYYLVNKSDGSLWNGDFNISKINEISRVELVLAFGIKNSGAFKRTNYETNGIDEIYIEFSSELDSIESLYSARFLLNDIVIDDNEYSIYYDNDKKNRIRIVFDNPITTIDEEEIDFEIIDFEVVTNRYGMGLAKELNKCTLKLIN